MPYRSEQVNKLLGAILVEPHVFVFSQRVPLPCIFNFATQQSYNKSIMIQTLIVILQQTKCMS